MPDSLFKRQILPLGLTVVTCGALVLLLRFAILGLNRFTPNDILLTIHPADVLVGLTIYLKTSIDFAVFIGRLMRDNNDWKSRIAIEVGTALGNAVGTIAVLALWTFFKEVRWLLAIMILLASLVLFRLADDSLVEYLEEHEKAHPLAHKLSTALKAFNRFTHPLLRFIIPNFKSGTGKNLPFWPLFTSALTIPFVLGLDDFAGYVPLFNVVNVFGFAIGVFAGHMILNAFLYVSPERTMKLIRNQWFALLGSLVFIGLGVWGLVEVVRLFVQ